jgi:integrase/recombinase XerD
MPPEPRPELQPGIPEPRNTAIVARAAGAEEAKTTSVAARDWAIAPTPIPPDTTDAELVALWLHGKSPNTIRAYGDDVAAFRRFTGKPLRATYLSDLQRYADSLVGAPATRGRRLKTLKSLLSFATRMGYLPFNAGAAIHGPALEQKLAERILSERQVFALLEAVEDRPRDHALIRLLYNGGLRVSELVTLRWRNLVEGVANVTGKGGKTRVVRLSRGTWAELQVLRTAETIGEDCVFPMSAVNAWKRVKRAARLAGISEVPVSPHFLRHSHGTHALRRGADLATVRDTLGDASIATTSRYLHARPEKSSGDYLAL